MIHILFADISCVDSEIYNILYALADAQRQLRADHYLQFADKVRCIVAGGLLRYAVKRSLGLDTFETAADPNGKPYVIGAPDFHFNLSHAGKWVVIAYADTPVGIDVEQIDARKAISSIAGRFYAPDERDYVLGNPERFFEIWTAKESYIKYVGKGLQMGLGSFSVFTVEGVCFSPIAMDPKYRMTLCAKEKTHTVEQINLAQLLK